MTRCSECNCIIWNGKPTAWVDGKPICEKCFQRAVKEIKEREAKEKP